LIVHSSHPVNKINPLEFCALKIVALPAVKPEATVPVTLEPDKPPAEKFTAVTAIPDEVLLITLKLLAVPAEIPVGATRG
jgi:hypothetical protein